MDSPTEFKSILLTGLKEVEMKIPVYLDQSLSFKLRDCPNKEFSAAWREHAAFQSIILSFSGYILFLLKRLRPFESPLRVSTAADARINREFRKYSPPDTPTSGEMERELTEYIKTTSSFLKSEPVTNEWHVVQPRRGFSRDRRWSEPELEESQDMAPLDYDTATAATEQVTSDS
ncbi:hypothetical protein BDV11DRAFT_176243 [Aspergillus similis]